MALSLLALALSVAVAPASRVVAAPLHTPAARTATNHAAALRSASRQALPAALVSALRHRSGVARPSGTAWTQRAEFTGIGIGGQSVAISGTTAIAGSPDANNYVGAVAVFVNNGGTWSQQATITATDGATNAQFGAAVAFNGTTLVVGAPGHNHSGAVYVFVRSGTTWTQQAELTVPNTRGLGVGSSVALSGGTILVGTQPRTGAPGLAFVFVFNGTSWIEEQKLSASDGSPDDNFGFSVGLTGATAMVGAPGAHSNVGAVYVFTRSGTTWTQQQEITPSGPVGAFGAVALNGSTALLGAINTAYVYVRSSPAVTAAWTQQAVLAAPSGSSGFGGALALGGNTAVAGAYQTNDNTGAAYVYVRSGSGSTVSWSQQATLSSKDASRGDRFGYAVATNGSIAVIGAPQKPAVYIFERG